MNLRANNFGNFEAHAAAVQKWRLPTEEQAAAAWGLPPVDPAARARQTDLLMALQAYGQTGTAKLQLVADLRAALTHQFGPVAGRTIAQMAGE